MAKRIAFLVDSIFTIGGVQRVTAVIAKALTKDYDVTIITLDSPILHDRHLYGMDEVPDLKIKYFAYPEMCSWYLKLCKVYSYLYRKYLPQCEFASNLYAKSSLPNPHRRALATELNDGAYDTVIAVHVFFAIRLATVSSMLHHCQCIGWIHNSFDALTCKDSPYLGTELKRHYGYQLKKLNSVVTLYHQDALRYQQEYGLAVKTIYNPLTLQPGNPAQGNSKQLLAIGRMTPMHKGFDLLIDAFAALMDDAPGWTLHIVGDGPEKQNRMEQIQQHHAKKRIILHPFTQHIQDHYQQAQLYVLSSRWEGMPLVLVEAMAHGLPIVSADLPTCKEVMGSHATYFHTGDVEDMKKALHQAMNMTDWQEQSRQSLRIASHFKLDTIINQWKEILSYRSMERDTIIK